MGAGFAAFESCSVEHTMTGYDEVLYVISGSMSLRQDNQRWRAGPGDLLWIPADETFIYKADEILYDVASRDVWVNPKD